MTGLRVLCRRSTIIASIVMLLFLAACELPGGKKFSITFNELKGLKENDKIYIYPAEIAIGKVDSIGVFQGKAEVFVKLDSEFPDAVTMDSDFFIDIDPLQEADKCILVSVPENPGKEVIPRNKRLSGIDSRLQWAMVLAEKKISPALSEFLNDYADRLNGWYDKNLKTVPDKDWDRLGNDIKREMFQLYEQAKVMAGSECAKKSLDSLRAEIEAVRKKLERFAGSKEAMQLKKSLEEMLDRLERDLGMKKSEPGLSI